MGSLADPWHNGCSSARLPPRPALRFSFISTATLPPHLPVCFTNLPLCVFYPPHISTSFSFVWPPHLCTCVPLFDRSTLPSPEHGFLRPPFLSFCWLRLSHTQHHTHAFSRISLRKFSPTFTPTVQGHMVHPAHAGVHVTVLLPTITPRRYPFHASVVDQHTWHSQRTVAFNQVPKPDRKSVV